MSGTDICNECLAKQARDYPLSKAERESLVHRWRKGGSEHFRRDCRWWPREGTAFGQRGLDLRMHIEAGASEAALLWVMNGLLVLAVVPALALAQMVSDSYAGIALILGALTPVMLAVIGVIANRSVKRVEKAQTETQAVVAETAKKTEDKLSGIHTLVNDNLTREKSSRLILLRANKVLLLKTFGDSISSTDQLTIDDIQRQIEALESEIAERDKAAASLKPEEK